MRHCRRDQQHLAKLSTSRTSGTIVHRDFLSQYHVPNMLRWNMHVPLFRFQAGNWILQMPKKTNNHVRTMVAFGVSFCHCHQILYIVRKELVFNISKAICLCRKAHAAGWLDRRCEKKDERQSCRWNIYGVHNTTRTSTADLDPWIPIPSVIVIV